MSPSISSRRPFRARRRRIPGPPVDPVKGRLLGLYVALRRARGLARPGRIVRVSAGELAGLIRAGGTPRGTARRLHAFTTWLSARFDGRVSRMRRAPLGPLRRELLSATGAGPETADTVLLHAAGRPVFVVDAAARRVLGRHRLLHRRAPYEQARAFVEAHLPSDPALFKDYQALLVAVRQTYCRALPRCGECPLRFDLGGRPPAPP